MQGAFRRPNQDCTAVGRGADAVVWVVVVAAAAAAAGHVSAVLGHQRNLSGHLAAAVSSLGEPERAVVVKWVMWMTLQS